MTTRKQSSFEQELNARLKDLEVQHKMRQHQLVELALNPIKKRVQSKESEIMRVISGKSGTHAIQEIIVNEIKRAAKGLLWCDAYVEKLKSNQHVRVYTGTHWEQIEPQQWKDFISECAKRCGLSDSFVTENGFMNRLFERMAFNVAEYRKAVMADNEMRLNLLNGTLELKGDGSIVLREHRKEDLFSYTLDYSYNPEARSELWEAFLNKVLPDESDQKLLAEYIGYCMTPTHMMEKMLIMFGEGLNGKSVTLEIIEALLGYVNVSYNSLSDLTTDDVKRASFEEKLANISHESGRDVNANVLKQLTSGERVTIKHLYQDPRETNNYGKIIAAFNEMPRAENTFGFFRRLIILPYNVTIAKNEIDRNLSDKLKTELPGILNWVLESLPGLMERCEFTASENSEKALEVYRLKSDSVLLFAREMCEASDSITAGSVIYNSYTSYCKSSSLKPVSVKKFYERLEKSFAKVSYGNAVHFKISLVE